MKLHCNKCIPSCDYCRWAKHGDFERDGTTWPIGCKKTQDEEHQRLARANLSCKDFECYRADRIKEP